MKNVKRYLMGMAMVLFLSFGFTSIKTEAVSPPAKVTGVKQVGADSGSFEVEWTALPGEDVCYLLEYSQDKKNWKALEDTVGDNFAVLDELQSGTTYYVRIKSVIETYNETTDDLDLTYSAYYSDVIDCVTTPEEEPAELNKISSTATSISLQWEAVEGANAYIVEYEIWKEDEEEADDEDYDDEECDDEDYEDYDDEEYGDEEADDEEVYDEEVDEEVSDEEVSDEEADDEDYDDEDYDDEEDEEEESVTRKSVTVTTNKAVINGLEKNKKYSVWVYAARKNSKGSYIAWDKDSGIREDGFGVTPTKVKKLAVEKYNAKKGQVVVKCETFQSADGYEVQVWTADQKNAKKDKKIGTANADAPEGKSATVTISTTKKALKKASFFKVRMRAYTLNSNDTKKYGEWSGWKYISQQPNVKKRQVVKKGIKLTWGKVKGADRYTIYVSTKKKSGYKKVGTSKKTTYTIKKFNKKKLKKGTKYYFYVVAENKVGKKFVINATGKGTKCWNKKYK